MDPDTQDDSTSKTDPVGLWTEILSADPDRVRHAFDRLPAGEARLVRDHLRRMATGEGWLPAQRRNARAALDQIGPHDDTEA